MLKSFLGGDGISTLQRDQPGTDSGRGYDIMVARALSEVETVQVQPLDGFSLGAGLGEGSGDMERPCPDSLRQLHREYLSGDSPRLLPTAANPPERQERPEKAAGKVQPTSTDGPVQRGPRVALLSVEQPDAFETVLLPFLERWRT